MENRDFLTKQLITYIGNKRKLLQFIEQPLLEIKAILQKDKLVTADLFAGTGAVSRLLKQHSSKQYSNDLEYYSYLVNKVFLMNRKEFPYEQIRTILKDIEQLAPVTDGIIRRLYSPKDDKQIQLDDRAFYTNENAIKIDTIRKYIDNLDEDVKEIILALLLVESSIKVNTSGVFKGFYKDKFTKIGKFGGTNGSSLERIQAPIQLTIPELSNYESEVVVTKEDACTLAKALPKTDVVYLDPPYNQHPYGSNYFMLNVIANYEEPQQVSKVSGIPDNWNRSVFNKKEFNLASLVQICQDLNTSFVLISFNDDGFYTVDEMLEAFKTVGNVKMFQEDYTVFKGCRNRQNRSSHVHEILFMIDKRS